MDQVCIDSDSTDDCVIQESQISTVEILDTSLEETLGDSSQTNGDIIEAKNTTLCSTDEPLLRLVFKNGDTFDELQGIISACIRDALFSLKKPIEVSVKRDELSVNFGELIADDGLNDSIFMIDTLPTEISNQKEVPDYKSAFDRVLNDEQMQSGDEDDEDNDKARNVNNCWNCGGDHVLRDCTEPRDMNQINKSKQAFVKGKNERYHVDVDQKFAHLLPGVISEDLKEALGLRKRELPLFIYRMRLFGYPPGWLEEAKVSHSGLSLFISEKMQNNDPDLEDGEVEGKITYDPNKFISYPGFNAECGEDMRDESRYHNVPQMQNYQSKEAMLVALQGNLAKSYKRKKLRHIIKEDTGSEDNSVEMEIAENDDDENAPHVLAIPPVLDGVSSDKSDSVVQRPSDKPLGEESNDIEPNLHVTALPIHINLEESTKVVESPSMQDLQRQKRDLLRALAESNDVSVGEDSLIEDILELDKTVEGDLIVDDVSKTPTSVSIDNLVIQTPTSSLGRTSRLESGMTVGAAKEIVGGTPLLKSASPFSKLPDGGNWSIGVTDVIDFENLPDATGTYEKLSGLIRKVRTVVKKINDQNDAEEDDE